MKSILVAGGAGYIGSHTAKALARSGYLPVVLDNFSTGNRWAVRWGPLIEGDLADRRLVVRTLKNHRIVAVMHFAANALVGESMENPYKYLHGNAMSSLELLEAMREVGVRHIVFSSTCATYGAPQSLPISEVEEQAPVNPYGESKLYVERALQWYEQAYGLTSVILRYFNAAGADPEGEIGEWHEPETHLIPSLIQATLGQRPEVHLMGADYDTPDGTAIRDYTHVTDLADAHIRALEYLVGGGASSAFNLGTGRGHSVREVIAAVEQASGQRAPILETARRAGDPPVLVANNARAREKLGWKPRFVTLDAICQTAWKWHCSSLVPRFAAAAAGD